MSGKNIKEIGSNDFEAEVINSDQPVIVDFYSTDCPPCEALAPRFEALSERFGSHIKFVKIFRQENRELSEQLNVKASPTLLYYNEGREVGRRMSGAIKKREMIDELAKLLKPEEFAKLNQAVTIEKRSVDVAILGGGPAGLTAALYSAQARLKTVVLELSQPGGQVRNTHLISNYPGTVKPVAGWELAHNLAQQASDSGAEILSALDVDRIEHTNSGVRILVDGETEIEARTLIVATGSTPRKLNIPGEKELFGHGISYCATCDGKYYEDREVVVIGGGNSAVEESLFLARFASRITVVHQFGELQANQTAQNRAEQEPKINFIFNSEPRQFISTEDGRLAVKIENIVSGETSTIETDGVFIYAGMEPNTAGLDELNLSTTEDGYIKTDESMATSEPGIFAIGDVRVKAIRQAITAAADGAIAAISSQKYISGQSEASKTDAATGDQVVVEAVQNRYSAEACCTTSLSCGDSLGKAQLQAGETVIDLGSGRGLDAIKAARAVGESGMVYGIDSTSKMIQLAKTNSQKLKIDNVEFIESSLEKINLPDNTADVIISNCVINHSRDKAAAFQEIFRLLKSDGRVIISDVIASEKLPEEVKSDPEAWAGCYGGAVTMAEYLGAIHQAGFASIEIVEQSAPYEKGGVKVFSATLQLGKNRTAGAVQSQNMELSGCC